MFRTDQSCAVKLLVAIKSPPLLDSLLTVIGEIEGVKSMGYVSTAEDAIGLINMIRVDVMIVEVLLRDGSGLDVLTHAKEMKLESKVVRVTDAPFIEYKHKSMELGADYFFNLDRDFESFQKTLKMLSRICSCGQIGDKPNSTFNQL